MRYDQVITFVKKGTEIFDRATGKYSDAGGKRTNVPAIVSDMGLQKMQLLLGSVAVGAKTFLIRGCPPDFDLIEYAGKAYKSEIITESREDTAIEATEVSE